MQSCIRTVIEPWEPGAVVDRTNAGTNALHQTAFELLPKWQATHHCEAHSDQKGPSLHRFTSVRTLDETGMYGDNRAPGEKWTGDHKRGRFG